MRLPRRATYADYMALERGSERRHEFFDGVIVAMAGGSDEPNALAGQVAGLAVAEIYDGILDAAGTSLLRA